MIQTPEPSKWVKTKTPERRNFYIALASSLMAGAIVLGVMMLVYDPQTIDDEMEDLGFTKVCWKSEVGKTPEPVCSEYAWVRGHESVATGDAKEYVRIHRTKGAINQ